VGEAEIKQYEESLKALGYPDVFIDTNIESIRKYFSYLQNKNYINNYNGFIE
jgi:site-specific recombinase XerD